MPVKKKTAKKKVTKKVTKKKKSPEVGNDDKNDSDILENIGSGQSSDVQDAGPGEISEEKTVIVDDNELTPLVSPDYEAIHKTKTKKPKGRPAKRSPSKPKNTDKPGAVDDAVVQFLKPDALKAIFTIGNNRLAEAGSIWAMPDGELDDMSNAVIAVVDKYFPEIEEWGVEATLAFTALMYAVPRFMMMKQSQAKPVETEPVKPAEPELEKVPPAPKSTDPRLDRYK